MATWTDQDLDHLSLKVDRLLAGQKTILQVLRTGQGFPLTLTLKDATINIALAETPTQQTAVSAQIILKGAAMPGQITVDTTNETVAIQWVDDKGDTDASVPEGATVTFTSDNEAVATVDPTSGAITPVAEGTANIGATLTGADGNPLLEADGVTPFAQPSPVAVTVSAGAAVGDSLSLSV